MPLTFHGTRITANASSAAWGALIQDYEAIVRASLTEILDRSERRTGGTLIDTKFDVVTGQDADPDDPLRGPATIFGWIQARGLESLGRHCLWLASRDGPGDAALAQRTGHLLRSLIDRLDAMRRRHGRLAFMMDVEGRPLRVTEHGVEHDDDPMADGVTLTDLFFAKGLAEAAAALNDEARLRDAEELFRQIVQAVEADRIIIDQQALDPKNPVRPVPGRHTHAPRMLAIGGATRLYSLTGEAWLAELGQRMAGYLLEHHVAPRACGPLQRGDFWEFIDDRAQPYLDRGLLWSDPGHAIEAAGLALRHLRASSTQRQDDVSHWTRVLMQNFENGFRRAGICKSFDLNARRPINTDMPWWSLPETLRAVAEAMTMANADARGTLRAIFTAASNAFFSHYLRPERALMALQCLDTNAQPIRTVPAVPDIDPGYHTNICLIDVISLFEAGNLDAAIGV